jgi:hypothetical protein
VEYGKNGERLLFPCFSFFSVLCALRVEEEEVAGDCVLVALRIGVLGLDAPCAEDFGDLRMRFLECERVDGVVDAGECFREPESEEVAAQLADRRGGVVVL